MIKGYHITKGNRQSFISQVERLDPTVDWVADIRPYKAKRSNPQNDLYWKFITSFGNYLGYTPDEMHDICKFKFLRNAVEINGERLPLLKSTTKLTTAEMASYFEAIERWSSELGFYFDKAAA